jgi:S-adenosylmethionine:tRNA ribosyltransferase-isomerase
VNALAFELPVELEARTPPEARGLARDGVKLLVARRGEGTVEHRTFLELPELLAPGDLLVINVSATVPAALPATRRDGSAVRVHVSTRAPSLGREYRIVEVRSGDGRRPERGRAGEQLALNGGGQVDLVAPYATGARLHLARFVLTGSVEEHLARRGQPIRYGHVEDPWPLEAYQNVYARTPGSAEMPSAGRPFTARLITALVARGVLIAPVTLHCGVSSPEHHEPPFPEEYEVPASTVRALEATRAAGGRVVAVGTTVVRALESAAEIDGRLRPARGWTNLVVTEDRPLQAVDGLITGWHEPEASHMQMLAAIAGRELLEHSYAHALAHGYLWHEFGDSHFVLP